MSHSTHQDSFFSTHRALEYVPAFLLCVMVWILPQTDYGQCMALFGPPEQGFAYNLSVFFCRLATPFPQVFAFTVLILFTSVPISYRAWARWSRYRLSRNHPVANVIVSLMSVIGDYAACYLLISGDNGYFDPIKYLMVTILVSLSLMMLIYSEIVSNDRFSLAESWKDPDFYSLILVLLCVWIANTGLIRMYKSLT